MPITVARLQKAEWKLVFSYDYNDKGAGFKTYAADAIPGITITHDRKIGSPRTLIYYTVNKRKTDSPSEAVKMWNRAQKDKVT